MAKRRPKTESAMDRIRRVFERSGMTMQQLGEEMGYPKESARKSVSQFLKSDDPRVSMVERFARATGKKVSDFVK
jgi:transcriptional regulator with XRE-family HTH domain